MQSLSFHGRICQMKSDGVQTLKRIFSNTMLAETGSIPKEPDPWQDRIMDESLARNNYPKEKLTLFKQHAIEIGHCSLMAKHMSPDIFERYRWLTSSGNGNWTISRAINTGIIFPSAYMGIHAGDPESYDTFVDIFKPCIEDYHTGFSWDSGRPQQTDLNADNLSMKLTPDAKSRIISSRIRVARNLGGDFVMNPNGSAQSRIDVLHTVQKAVEEIDEDLRGKVHVHSTMSAAEEQALIDDHFLFKGRDKRQAACGYHEYWPHGRGIFQSKDKQFNIWINEGDHLRVMVMIPSADIVGVLRKLSRGLSAIEKSISSATQVTQPFARHPVLGMVTCCPTNLGTGCRASVHMHLPRLLARLGLEGIDKVCRQQKCQARGSSGEFSDVAAAGEGAVLRVDISNRCRLGYSEVELVEHMITAANLLAAMESAAEKEEEEEQLGLGLEQYEVEVALEQQQQQQQAQESRRHTATALETDMENAERSVALEDSATATYTDTQAGTQADADAAVGLDLDEDEEVAAAMVGLALEPADRKAFDSVPAAAASMSSLRSPHSTSSSSLSCMGSSPSSPCRWPPSSAAASTGSPTVGRSRKRL